MATIDTTPGISTYFQSDPSGDGNNSAAVDSQVVFGTVGAASQYKTSNDISLGNVGMLIESLTFGGGATQTIIQTVTTIVTGSVLYSKRGFRLATGQYEYWQSNVWDDGPPSGNALVDITVIGTVRNTT